MREAACVQKEKRTKKETHFFWKTEKKETFGKWKKNWKTWQNEKNGKDALWTGTLSRGGSKNWFFCKVMLLRTRAAIEARKKNVFSAPKKRKGKRKNMKVKSLSNGPLLKNLVHRGPKIEFSQKEIDIFTVGIVRTNFFWFWRPFGRLKKEKKKKEKKGRRWKNMKNEITKEKKNQKKQKIEEKRKRKNKKHRGDRGVGVKKWKKEKWKNE